MNTPVGVGRNKYGPLFLPDELSRFLVLAKSVDVLRQKLSQFPDDEIRRLTRIGVRSRFGNNGGQKLFELNSQLSLTKNVQSVLDLCGGPGGFVKYLLTATKVPVIVGVTLSGKDFYWKEVLEDSRFTAVMGEQSGDVFSSSIVDALMKAHPRFDLVLCDGCQEGPGSQQEQWNWPLVLRQARLALVCMPYNGKLVIKSLGNQMPEYLALFCDLSLLFRDCRIMKPYSSRSANSEVYWVFMHYKGGGIKPEYNEASWYEYSVQPHPSFLYYLAEMSRIRSRQAESLSRLIVQLSK